MSGRNPFDTVAKRVVREQWNSPILRFLNEEHGFRYRYLGLPGVDLLDVQAWREVIEEVVAFEVPARRTQSDPHGRRNIAKLRRNLRLLGIPGRAYFGPMEEVVILRRDYDGNRYDPSKVITLYNLDFCDEISSAIETEDGRRVWRFEAIRQILTDQRAAFQEYGGPGVFVVLLTIRNQIESQKLRGFLSHGLYEDTRAYLEECGGVHSLPESGAVLGTQTWALKAFIHNTLRQYFVAPHMSAVFFPLVHYFGTPIRGRGRSIRSPMLHCMVVCHFDQRENPSPSYLPSDFLSEVCSVAVKRNGKLAWHPQIGEPATQGERPSSLTWMQRWGSPVLNALAP